MNPTAISCRTQGIFLIVLDENMMKLRIGSFHIVLFSERTISIYQAAANRETLYSLLIALAWDVSVGFATLHSNTTKLQRQLL